MGHTHGKDFQYKTKNREAADIEQPAMDFAERAGWIQRKLQWFGKDSAPDRFLARRGRVILIEFKGDDGRLSKGQELEIPELRAAGVEVHIIDNLEDAYDLLA